MNARAAAFYSRPRGKVTHSTRRQRLRCAQLSPQPCRKIAIKAAAHTAGRIVALENCSVSEVAAQAPLNRQPPAVSHYYPLAVCCVAVLLLLLSLLLSLPSTTRRAAKLPHQYQRIARAPAVHTNTKLTSDVSRVESS